MIRLSDVFSGDYYKTVANVVADGLCHSCGTCGGICPHNAIFFNECALPVINDECDECGLCLKVCSGLKTSTAEPFNDRIKPHYFLSATNDRDLRLRSSSGGFVTELLRYLFRTGLIAGAIVTVADPDNPIRPLSIYATSEEDLLRSSQSRYSLFPWGMIIKELKKVDKPFAVVGTSCQLNSLQKAMAYLPAMRKNIAMTVGICCNSNIEPQATDHLLHLRSIEPTDVKILEYRHGKWPGTMTATLRDGTVVTLSNRYRLEGAINYLKLTYGRKRCRLCYDVLCEPADITVGDPWVRTDKGEYCYRDGAGFSAVLVRSNMALSCLQKMAQEDAISLEEQKKDHLFPVQLHQRKIREQRVARAIVSAGRNGRPFPWLNLNLEAGDSGQRIAEKISDLLFWLGHTQLFRMCFLALIFSRVGDLITLGNTWRKRLHYRQMRIEKS